MMEHPENNNAGKTDTGTGSPGSRREDLAEMLASLGESYRGHDLSGARVPETRRRAELILARKAGVGPRSAATPRRLAMAAAYAVSVCCVLTCVGLYLRSQALHRGGVVSIEPAPRPAPTAPEPAAAPDVDARILALTKTLRSDIAQAKRRGEPSTSGRLLRRAQLLRCRMRLSAATMQKELRSLQDGGLGNPDTGNEREEENPRRKGAQSNGRDTEHETRHVVVADRLAGVTADRLRGPTTS